MAGYSGTPLVRKLGLKADHRVALLHAPPQFDHTLGPLLKGVLLDTQLQDGDAFDVIVFFTKDLAELRRHFGKLSRRLVSNGGLWIAWPKRASGVATDLTEDVIRVVGLDAGLVDNKVCAVDDTWSGLRFVIRVQDRPKKARREP